MTRPKSIVWFERLYVAALAIAVLNAALNWTHYLSMPQVQRAQAMFGVWYLPGTLAIGFLVPLVLWYAVARRGSIIAKWIVVVFAAIGLAGQAVGLLFGSYVSGTAAVLGLAALALNLAAAAMLFRSDALTWFGERRVKEIVE